MPDALWYFAAGAGDPTAVVAAPVLARASDWAGQLRGLGYEAMPAATGRDALVAAFDPVDRAAAGGRSCSTATSASRSSAKWCIQLRSADRTARVPIIIAASPEHLPHAQRIAADDPLVLAAPRPRRRSCVFDELVERALALSTQPLADRPTRTQQAAQALDWIAKLLAAGAPYDELRRDGSLVNRTLFVPELDGTVDPRPGGARHGRQPSRAGRLRQLAVGADRKPSPAAEALAASVAKFGIQLTREQILRQYDRYNASETADADTQQVLGSILDVLEKKK